MYEYGVIEKIYPSQLESVLNEWAKGDWRLWGYSDNVVILERERR